MNYPTHNYQKKLLEIRTHFNQIPECQRLGFLKAIFQKMNPDVKRDIFTKIIHIEHLEYGHESLECTETDTTNIGDKKISDVIKFLVKTFEEFSHKEQEDFFIDLVYLVTEECKRSLMQTLNSNFEAQMLEEIGNS